jgi:hypothetical protein
MYDAAPDAVSVAVAPAQILGELTETVSPAEEVIVTVAVSAHPIEEVATTL